MNHQRRSIITWLPCLPFVGTPNRVASQELNDLSAKKAFLRTAMADITLTQTELQQRQADGNAKGLEPAFLAVPMIRAFLDWDYFYIDSSLVWAPNSSQSGLPTVTVPKGFVSDLASVPSICWSVFPKTGRYAYAAVVHDYLYWTKVTSKPIADKVMIDAMLDLNVDTATIRAFRLALVVAGGKAWEDNRRLRQAGEKRVLSTLPDDPRVSWSDWKARPSVFKAD